MNDQLQPAANPFALLMDPESVFLAIEKSERLARLQSRVCRPLDRPLLPHAPAEDEAAIEATADDAHQEHHDEDWR